MNHQNLKDKLFLYNDPELAEAEREELTSHLSECGECRNLLGQFNSIQKTFPKISSSHSSETFVNQVMNKVAALESDQPSRAFQIPLPRWVFPALGYGFALFLMFVAVTHQHVPVNAETVLLTDMPEESQWMVLSDLPNVDQLVEVSREDV